MTKLLFLSISVFMFASTTYAASKFSPLPRVSAWSHGVDLTIVNFSELDYRCSGPIYVRYTDGRSDSEYFSGVVYAQSTERRFFYNRRASTAIRTASNSILCVEI